MSDPIQPPCPYGDAILHYANERGVVGARLEYHPSYGWEMYGDGDRIDGWPRVWSIVEELGIGHGCGWTDSHQIKPENFLGNRLTLGATGRRIEA